MRVLMKTMNYEEANKRVIESIVNSAIIKAHQEVKKAQLAETMKSINKPSKEDSTPLKKFSRKKKSGPIPMGPNLCWAHRPPIFF